VVQEALDRVMQRRTTLVVAHRLSTVRSADAVLVISGGAVVERGTHDELMAAAGVYSALVQRQMVEKKS
jgi:ABC-type multidrug transport system fused ATPase/permease subunit